MFLTPDELRALTGYKRRADQFRWLREHHWRAHVNGAGEVCVARAYWERRMVGNVTTEEPRAEPNFAALGER